MFGNKTQYLRVILWNIAKLLTDAEFQWITACNRKNALFSGHDADVYAWARIASLIETCKLKGVRLYAYLKATFKAIAAAHPNTHSDELTPWHFGKNQKQDQPW